MAISIADGFQYLGNKPLDSRIKYATLADLIAVSEANLYDGCEAYVTATKKYYSFDSSNTADPTLGKWRERTSGGGGGGVTDYSELTGKPSIDGVELDGAMTAEDLGLAKEEDIPDVPTKTSDLNNDSGFITNVVNDLVNYYLKTETYSKTETDSLIAAIKNSRFEVVSVLPTEDIKTNVIYLVPSSDPQTSNVKDEYINLDGTTAGWEKIGSTSVDLSGYVTDSDLTTALNDYVAKADMATYLADYALSDDVHNIPEGGTTGQVLKKVSGTDYDVEWADEEGGGSGGSIVNGYIYREPFVATTAMDYINWIRNHTDKTILVPNESIFTGKTANYLYMVLAPAAAYLLFSEFPFNLKVYYLNRSGTKIFNSTRLSQDGTTIVGFNSNGTFTYANGITQAKQVSIHDEVDCDYLADNDKEAQLFVTPNINLLSNMYKDNTVVIENQLAFYSDSSHTTLITPVTGKFYVDTPTGDMYEWDGTKYKNVGGSGGGTSDYADLENKPQINSVTLSGNKSSDDLDLQGKMQFSTMPTAAAAYAGKTVQFTGATAGGYTHNYFYECVEESGTYSWQVASVQSGGGSSGHTIVDSEDTEMTARASLKFGEGFDVTDDSTNDETVVEPTPLETGDMDSIVYPLPDMPHPNTSCGFTPVGTVISVMGNAAPLHYLACNGQVVNIADYPELADYFENQFGSANYFGGDGTTTFAVPDLSGEFLRGTGTNSHANQGDGEAVGTHQDASEFVDFNVGWSNTVYIAKQDVSSGNHESYGISNPDKVTRTGQAQAAFNASVTNPQGWDTPQTSKAATRPTNTSVLYCIATKDIYIDARSNYSTSEKVVGTWIDGKPLYQKTITGLTTPNTTNESPIFVDIYDVDYAFIDTLHSFIEVDATYPQFFPLNTPWNKTNTSGYNTGIGIAVGKSGDNNRMRFAMTVGDVSVWKNNATLVVTVQYTKTTD